MVRVWVLRNPTKSVAFPKPPRGNAEVSGRENRPRHSRWYDLPAHQARGAQHRRSPSYGRAKFRSYVKSAFSASPATADELTHKPPATLEESGCPRHICTANRGPKPAIRGRHGLNPKPILRENPRVLAPCHTSPPANLPSSLACEMNETNRIAALCRVQCVSTARAMCISCAAVRARANTIGNLAADIHQKPAVSTTVVVS